jgi:malate dehydrogenase
VLPACCWLEGEFGLKDIYFGVPCVIGKNGIEKILQFELTNTEKGMLEKSAAAVRGTMAATKL